MTSFEVYAPLVKLALALAAAVVLSTGGGTIAATTTPSSSPPNDPALEPLLLTIDDFSQYVKDLSPANGRGDDDRLVDITEVG